MSDLIKGLEQLNISDAEKKADILNKYMEGILHWNEKVNLTAITDREEFVQKHIIDSLLCVSSEEFQKTSSVIDVGTGGGFPGIPLAVAFPEKEFVLMDSLAKRLKIVDELCGELGINNVTTLHGRAEELGRQKGYRDNFDLCVSRAVANMSTLSEYCLPFVKAGGSFIAYKGPDCKSEINDASRAIRVLGGKLLRIDKAGLDAYNHELVYISKEISTPAAYPRKPGTPSRKPL